MELTIGLRTFMRVIAYCYTNPWLEPVPDPSTWGWEINQVYHDLAIAEPLDKRKAEHRSQGPRSQWQQLLQDCQTQPTDYVIVYRLEDLGESIPDVSDRLAELEALEIPLLVVETTQPDMALRADLLKLVQQVQSNQRGLRIKQGHARNRIKALPPPGKAPYGYRRGRSGYVVDRTTAPIVKEFFDNFLLFGSLRGAVRYIAKQYGKKIAVSTGQRWLNNPVYRGDLAYQDGRILRDTHTPIVSRDEAAQVDRLLRRNRRLPPRTATAPRSLAGLVSCAECQSSTTITRVSAPRQKTEYLYVRPTHCPKQPKCRALSYEAVLQAAIARICEELPQAIASVALPDLDQVKQGIGGAIAGKQAILAQLPTLVSSGILDQETADLRAYTVRTEIADLEGKLAQLPPVNLLSTAQTVSIPQFWLDLSESERRFYFREFLRQIQIVRQAQEWYLKLVFIF